LEITYTEMTIGDFDEVTALWEKTDGVGLDEDTDTRENMAAYLVRNAGLSFVARDGEKIVGAVLCGQDGRRGYMNHLAVSPSHRKHGIGKALVEKCISGLRDQNIVKCSIMVFGDNSTGLGFWKAIGWFGRKDLLLMQKWTS